MTRRGVGFPILRTFRGNPGGPYLRLHVGLESAEDLVADLGDGFARLRG